jgi:hypothetical protein
MYETSLSSDGRNTQSGVRIQLRRKTAKRSKETEGRRREVHKKLHNGSDIIRMI